MTFRKIVFLVCLIMILPAEASLLKYVPQQIVLPDGSELNCYASGDEYDHWLHDSIGYTIVLNHEDGFFYYAVEKDGKLAPSIYRANKIVPSEYGFKTWLRIPKEELQKKISRRPIMKTEKKNGSFVSSKNEKRYHEGLLNNIVVFIKFSDDPDFSMSRYYYDSIFNSNYSLKSYYKEVSYNKLNIVSNMYPLNSNGSVSIPYVDYNPRSFYQPYVKVSNPNGYQDDSQMTQRRSGLLKNALTYIKSQIGDTLVVDKNSDGRIDNICFIIRGNADGWSDLIWPHRSFLEGTRVYINGAYAYDYTFQMEQTTVKTLCHEMFHSLGSPDLYHYSYDGLSTVGNWDIMESGSAHMSAYMKFRYSDSTWIDSIPEIRKSGRYSLKPLYYSENNSYMFRNKSIDTLSFFIVEYRKNGLGTFEKGLPGSGLLVYRINPRYNGNASGPPDEVYLFRPNGTIKVNGDINLAAKSNISGWAWGSKNAPLFYNNGIASGMKISDISEATDSISFNVILEKSSEATINSFFVIGQTSTSVINKSSGLIYCNVNENTKLQNSKPILSISELATISPVSGSSVDLTTPFTYTVTAEDSTQRRWIVYADSKISTEAEILSCDLKNLDKESCVIDPVKRSISIVAPWDCDLSNVNLGIVGSNAATIEPDPYSVKDIQNPVTFKVTAENGTANQWILKASLDTAIKDGFLPSSDRLFKMVRTVNGLSIVNLSGKNANMTVYSITGQVLMQKILVESYNYFEFTGNQVLLIAIQNENIRTVLKSIAQ